MICVLGGVGFDINCGVRLLRTNLDFKDIQPVKEQLAQVSIVHFGCINCIEFHIYMLCHRGISLNIRSLYLVFLDIVIFNIFTISQYCCLYCF